MKLVTVQEAAEYLGIHPDTVRDWENKGHITATRTPGGHRRFDLEELESLMSGKKSPPKLSMTERRMLVNQHCILEILYPDESDHHKERAEIYRNGYELLYDDDWVDPKTLSGEQCEEVLDILSMFEKLKYSFEQLEDKQGIDEYRVKFHGFDGNGENWNGECECECESYMSFARFYCTERGYDRFKSLEITDFNSHDHVLEKYREMLGRYKKVQKSGQHLSKEEIIFICKN